MNQLVVLDCRDGALSGTGLEVLGAAAQCGGQITAIAVGADIGQVPAHVLYVLEQTAERSIAEQCAVAIGSIVSEIKPELILFDASAFGRETAARTAACLGVDCISDVVNIESEEGDVALTHLVFSGMLYEQLQLEGAPHVVTLHPGSFPKAGLDDIQPQRRELPAQDAERLRVQVQAVVDELEENVNLEEAEVIVSGGRGMGSAEGFELLARLAETLHGVVGATRPAIESGWISKQRQIGQSGKIVSPRLYIACGISGAAQHIAGIMDSDCILAINQDEEAPIFRIADIGLVGDVHTILPILIDKLKG